MKLASYNRQGGFTLVEIAIVLVIIGLLLGGVLKGTELIENAKVRNAANDINSISAAYNAYIDRFQAQPGDDGPIATLQARGGDWALVPDAGDGNGVVTSNRNNAFNGGNEHDIFWQHLRAAGFISGDVTATDAAALPRNAFNGFIGIVSQVTHVNLTGLKVCLGAVPGKAARALDTQLDDGDGATGSMRATLGNANGQSSNPGNVALAAPYTDASFYTVCTRI